VIVAGVVAGVLRRVLALRCSAETERQEPRHLRSLDRSCFDCRPRPFRHDSAGHDASGYDVATATTVQNDRF
jgi:hypothetical protein